MRITLDDPETTPNEVLRLAGLDPATNYLVRVDGRHQVSFEGRGDEQDPGPPGGEVRVGLHGANPRSHKGVSLGADEFLARLRAEGFDPTVVQAIAVIALP